MVRMETTYPLGHRSGKTLEQLRSMWEAATIRFYHGPHLYELPGVDSEDPVKARAVRDFLFAVHAALPDLLTELEKR